MSSAPLYIVPTPIGNLQDITQRAIDVLSSVAWIAAEDTRHSAKLLQHFRIQAKTLSLHDHNEDSRSQMLCQKLLNGETVALISDAGTPLISDPGYKLVSRCRDQGIDVIALPGPCAAITALSASGLATDKFIFEGFLPAKTVARQTVLEALTSRPHTTVFYEAPRRVLDTLKDVQAVLGDARHIVLAKELTKTFERYISGNAQTVIDWLEADAVHQKGEFVLMIDGVQIEKNDIPADAMSLLKRLKADLPLKKAAAIVADHYQLKKNALYQAGLDLE
ncbi:16S rRNA (cytidine(1402)-2'-O)-methyltransferase [Aestuariibacter sp. GS-14]|uniref:16S rRNA (cytidine(1402)-2'-O)-methyltransferase n=1 Tax=Aestuariibacter sp. GS-14 TaxID=2590670 RepID=UPI00112C34CA|nr:16S rRNA (cytidine(1402)-2'-O)-methyltransferase [Aestuariibacter sp. GS-14]TPV56814.1 16S rRNA (cytidine(1402)-2'-O)-methyltransferase [Aestuariibacter sp. GS-14]